MRDVLVTNLAQPASKCPILRPITSLLPISNPQAHAMTGGQTQWIVSLMLLKCSCDIAAVAGKPQISKVRIILRGCHVVRED